jgi:tRNA(His) guanylyltransferase
MSKTLDALGDRMKAYEAAEAQRRLMPRLPAMLRLDGRGFSKFTKDFARPFDTEFAQAMRTLTVALVEETNACVGYTQSDEISLVLHSDDPASQIYFDGRIQKIASCLAGFAATRFVPILDRCMTRAHGQFPTFDCRVWNVPTLDEAVNCLIWREQDATKNSISMAARHYYSHAELMNKNGKEMQELLHAKGVNWSDYPAFFKRGSYVRRVHHRRKFTAQDLEALPPMHNARRNPDLELEFSTVEVQELPRLASITNRVDVIFHGAAPEVSE